jgi:hypothetical protein
MKGVNHAVDTKNDGNELIQILNYSPNIGLSSNVRHPVAKILDTSFACEKVIR